MSVNKMINGELQKFADVGGSGDGGTTIVPKPTVTIGTYTYDGTEQGPTISFSPETVSKNCVITNATNTNAGTYTLTIALKNTAKMVWNDLTTADLTYTYTIARATSAITVSSDSVTLDGDHLTRSVTVSNAQGRTLSVSSSDTSIATASVSGNTITISNVNQTNGNATITISAAQSTNYNASSKTVSVSASFITIVSWANGSDAEIVKMLQAVDDGLINLEDYWSVGDERTVHLAGDINEDVVFVIEDLNGTTSGGTPYHAAVGQKNGLSTTRRMNSSNDNSGGYNLSTMRAIIEGDYQTALKNATTGNFWEAVKSANHKSQNHPSGLQSTTVKVILHSIFELCGSYNNAGDETTANGFHQFSWYTTTANRIKTQGEGGSAYGVWTRSAYAGNSYAFCYAGTNGYGDYYHASYSLLVAPFCCI